MEKWLTFDGAMVIMYDINDGYIKKTYELSKDQYNKYERMINKSLRLYNNGKDNMVRVN